MKYFDYAATCPIDEEALQAYVKASQSYFGNTSSIHDIGSQASGLVEQCRETIAGITGVSKDHLYFTSGGTESNFIGIQALLDATEKKGKHIIVSQAEHSSIQNIVGKLEEEGYSITKVPFTQDGLLDLNELQTAMTQDTVLVAVQHVNPEIGTIQPLEKVKQICDSYGAFLHSDCVQSFGKVSVKEVSPYLDSFAISGHKVYGPKGVGAVYISPELSFQPFLPNGSHESGVRPGTLNAPAIAGFTVAAQTMDQRMEANSTHFIHLYNTFINALEPVRSYMEVLPNSVEKGFSSIVGLCVKGVEGQWMMLEGNRHGFAFSTGSACSVGKQSASKTLTAMGIEPDKARTFIRVSFGKDQTADDVKELAQLLVNTIVERHQLVLK